MASADFATQENRRLSRRIRLVTLFVMLPMTFAEGFLFATFGKWGDIGTVIALITVLTGAIYGTGFGLYLWWGLRTVPQASGTGD